ncbi:hypothetical protein [Sulfurisphaera ohwakuensis]|uniref:hypothetical protein n=1 Tax=Sulfurisphaera ohwakuensis TaxID=69656 RepID=UPI0036F33C5F
MRKELLSLVVLSVFLLASLQGLLLVKAAAASGSETVYNFWLSSSGVSSTGGSAKYTSYINGPIGSTAGYLLTQTTGQSGYVILSGVPVTYGVYTIQAVMVNASSPPADEIALVLGPSSPVNFGGGAWPGSVSSNGGTMVGIELYSGTVNGYSGPAIFVYTGNGLALWEGVSAVPKPWQSFTLEVGVESSEIWVAYYIGNQLVANDTAYVGPTFASSEVEIHASTGGAYAGFLLLQVGYFSNLQIATIQNEISMGLDYLLNMGEDINGYGFVPEYASPSVSFLLTYTNGSTAYFVPGAPVNSPSYYGSPVYGTPEDSFENYIVSSEIIRTPPAISDFLVSETTSQVSINYKAFYYGTSYAVDSRTGYVYNYPTILFEANEVVNYGNPSPGVWSIQVIVNVNYTSSCVQSVQPYLASGFVLNQINSTAWEYTWSGQYFYPTQPSSYAPSNSFASSVALPQYPDEYFHSFRITIRHVQEMMDMLTEESSSLSNFHNAFYDTIYDVQSSLGVWGLNGNQPTSYYAALFGYSWQPNMGINFYDAINDNWPTYKDDVFNLFFPYAYPYKSGVVVINENDGGDIWASILNGTLVQLNETFSIGPITISSSAGANYDDVLALAEEGLYRTNVGQWSDAVSDWNGIINFYDQHSLLSYGVAVYENGNQYCVYVNPVNDTLRYAMTVALGSKLAGNGYISWSEVLNFVNILTQTQWQGKGYAVVNGQTTYVLAPTYIGGFDTGFTFNGNSIVFSSARPSFVNEVEYLWGKYGGTLSGGLPEEVEYPGTIIANAESTIAAVQALALFLYYYYGIPLSTSLSPYNAFLIP